MNQIVRGIKATYNFFAGDAIILAFVIVAFIGAWGMHALAQIDNRAVALTFVALIIAGLSLTLNRELGGRPKTRH